MTSDWEYRAKAERQFYSRAIDFEAENVRLRAAIIEACSILSERKFGNSSRSPGHNARLILEDAIANDLPQR